MLGETRPKLPAVWERFTRVKTHPKKKGQEEEEKKGEGM